MSRSVDMDAESDAIKQAMVAMRGNRATRSTLEYLEKRLISAANRLSDGARIVREREAGGGRK